MSAMSEKIGIMVCGHGSRDGQAVTEFEAVARGIAERLPQYDVDSGFLEFATPIIRDGLDRLRLAGNTRILAIPGMLFAAGHAKNDIPSVVNTYAAEYPDLQIDYGRELGIVPKMIRAAGARVEEALAAAGDDVPREETALVVVGRGASDPDANSNVAKVMRLLWEGLGLGWGETAYSGVTFPLVEPGLEHVAKLGYRRIVVFPYFLFTGILVKRIYHYTDVVAARHPDIEFIKAPYLNDHPLVLDTFADRVGEILEGSNVMNCQLCKYREQVLGFEKEVGLAQQSHHHHVEGIGTGDTHDHGHDHGHPHDHHHHHPYPHAEHPLGPTSMKAEDGEG
jgi:sirohydrochlorin cobaltochelatase